MPDNHPSASTLLRARLNNPSLQWLTATLANVAPVGDDLTSLTKFTDTGFVASEFPFYLREKYAQIAGISRLNVDPSSSKNGSGSPLNPSVRVLNLDD